MDKSKWSSFEEDEEFTDAWREFLEEGVWDNIKTGVRAGTQAYRGAKVAGRSAARDAKRTLGGEVDSVTQGMGAKGGSSATDTATAGQTKAAGQPIKISVSDRYGKATSIEDMAMQALGMPTRPDPNKDRAGNRALQKLTIQFAQVIKAALTAKGISRIGISESEMKEMETNIIKELMSILNEQK
jgi:hypothetical protein